MNLLKIVYYFFHYVLVPMCVLLVWVFDKLPNSQYIPRLQEVKNKLAQYYESDKKAKELHIENARYKKILRDLLKNHIKAVKKDIKPDPEIVFKKYDITDNNEKISILLDYNSRLTKLKLEALGE